MKKLFFLALALLAQRLYVHAQVDLDNGLVANYSFNGGNANDEAGNNHGVVSGATLTTDRFGNVNKAYSFDGNDFINLGDSAEFRMGNGDFSLSIWVNYTVPQEAVIMQKRGEAAVNYNMYSLSILDDPQFGGVSQHTWSFTRSSNSTDRSVDAGNIAGAWHHLVLVHTYADSTTIFVDGQLVDADAAGVTGEYNIAGHPLVIGGNSSMSNFFYTGLLDDIRIYNRALNHTEVDSLYHMPNPTAQAAPTARYSFNNGNANDEIGTNHGTPNGVTLAADRHGNANKAYSFVNGDYIALPNAPELKNQSMTVSLWVAPDSFVTSNVNANYLYTVTNTLSGAWLCNFCLTLEPSSSKYLSVVQNGAAASNNSVVFASNATLPPMPQWSHYVLTMTHDSVKSYINGVPDVKGAKGFTTNFTADSIYLGTARNSNYYGDFNGRLDDIVVYNRALSATEVDSIYQAEKALPNGVEGGAIQAVRISPNPSEGLLQLSGSYDLCLTDLQGRILLSQAETDQIDLTALSAGMYLLQLRDREGQLVQTTRVVKM